MVHKSKALTSQQRWVLALIAEAGDQGMPLRSMQGADWPRAHSLERLGMVEQRPLEHGCRRIATDLGRATLRQPITTAYGGPGRHAEYFAVMLGDTEDNAVILGAGTSGDVAWRVALERGGTRESLQADGYALTSITAAIHAQFLNGDFPCAPADVPKPAVRAAQWNPTADPLVLRRMGKLLEEMSELGAVAARVIIQGLEEADPETGRANRLRLEEEIADVYAQLDQTMLSLKLRHGFIAIRRSEKRAKMQDFEAHLTPE